MGSATSTGRRLGLFACAVALGVASVAAAQTSPGSERAREEAPGPTLVRDDAGRPWIARGLRVETEGADASARAVSFVARQGGAFDLDGLGLVVDDVRATRRSTIVVFRREELGERVYGRSVRVRLGARNAVDLVVSDPGSRALSSAPRTATDEEVAARAASLAPFVDARAIVERVLFDEGEALVRGFAVEVDGPRLTDRAVILFDRHGRAFAGGDRAVHARGRVFVPNPVVAMDVTTDVELENLTSPDRLTGTWVRAAACPTTGRCVPIERAIADASGDFLFEPSEPSYEDPFSEVSAYFHTDRIAAYFRDTHGFTWSCCEMSTTLDVVANYTESPRRAYDNAAYSPSACSRSDCGGIVLGQGPLRDYAYDGDVVYHEYTHAVVDTLANIAGFDFDDLGISYEPSAINEGTADYFAATFTDSARVAEYFSGSGALGTPGALRDLDNDLRCPDSLFGEGHADGRIWGGTLWAVREILGADRADAIAYETLAMMADNTDFREAGELLEATAASFASAGELEGGELARISEEIARRGLTTCRRIVPIDDGEERLGYSGTAFATGTVGGNVAPTHYAIDIPADATSLTLDVHAATSAGVYTVLLRDGMSVRLVGVMPRADAALAIDGPLVFGDGDPHPLPRCQTLFIAVRADDLDDEGGGESVYSIRATLERSGDPEARCPEAPEPDAGVDVDAGPPPDAGDGGASAPRGRLGGGGCDCGVARPTDDASARPSLALLALLVLLAARRRRSARPTPSEVIEPSASSSARRAG